MLKIREVTRYFSHYKKILTHKKSRATTYLFHFSLWKKGFMQTWVPDRNLFFMPFNLTDWEFEKFYEKMILESVDADFLIWGLNAPEYLLSFLNENNIPYSFVEDGFLRSKRLGLDKDFPASLIFDNKTLHFNFSQQSNLEKILLEYDFEANPHLMARTKNLINFLVEKGVSKYNQGEANNMASIYGVKNRKRILILGQVEQDASIKYGCERSVTNKDLIDIAKKENPTAQLIYKPHPDTLKKNTDRNIYDFWADDVLVLSDNLSLSVCFDTIDHVYTITSLAGLEALMRGIKVTTIGSPFYSGWGLTDDRQLVSRRNRILSLEEVVAAAYILYPKYLHPYTKKKSTVEKIAYFLHSC